MTRQNSKSRELAQCDVQRHLACQRAGFFANVVGLLRDERVTKVKVRDRINDGIGATL